MNGQPQFQVINPLAETIEDAESIILDIQDAAGNLNEAIRFEREAQTRYKDALDNYEMAENDELAESIVLATQKEGPLGGIATTSKAYDIALTKLKNDLRRGALLQMWSDLDRYRRALDEAKSNLAQAETRFAALRRICDVKAMVLRASTI